MKFNAGQGVSYDGTCIAFLMKKQASFSFGKVTVNASFYRYLIFRDIHCNTPVKL